jgi:hypothetical protein
MSITMPITAADSESSTLFNPAFCALLLNKACAAYEAKAGTAMPITFAFLILPSALHRPTRAALPGTTASSMWAWLRSNPVILMGFANRVRTFRTFTGAAISYGLQRTVLRGSLGSIAAGQLKRRPRTFFPTDDWTECVKAAEFLGRWFGGSEADEATTLAHWGVKP